MTVSTQEYALLAANVYGVDPLEVRSPLNTLQIPAGWHQVFTMDLSDNTGFMARAYSDGTHLVISYAGTTSESWLDWTNANIPAATGWGLAEQIVQASDFYLRVLKLFPQYAAQDVSFTGHSLGGGLASLMAVFYDKPATVFDEAPFMKSADSLTIVNELRQRLVDDGYTLPSALADYQATWSDPNGTFVASATREAREGNVSQFYITGEVLQALNPTYTNVGAAAIAALSLVLGQPSLAVAAVLSANVNNIAGSETPYDLQAQAMLGWDASGTDLHSMTLLAGILHSPTFLATVKQNPELLARIFAGPYASRSIADPDVQTLLEGLVKHQVFQQGLSGGALDVLSADITSIARTGLTGQLDVNQAPLLRGALTDVALAAAHAQSKNGALVPIEQVFEAVQGGLTFDTLLLGVEAIRAVPALRAALADYMQLSVTAFAEAAMDVERWTVQSGEGPLSVSMAGNLSDAVVGFTGDDSVSAGNGDDLLFGNGGTDYLDAGAGDDLLHGGLDEVIDYLVGGNGFDTYDVADQDKILDSDGAGTIRLSSLALTGGNYVGTDAAGVQTYANTSDNVTYVWNTEVGSLTISHGTAAVVVENFTPTAAASAGGMQHSALGLNLVRTSGLPLVLLNASADALTLAAAAEVHALGGDDTLSGSSQGDVLYGGQGADTLVGNGGNDFLYAGADSDRDVLQGGAGYDTYYVTSNDVIVDSDRIGAVFVDNVQIHGGSFVQRTLTDFGVQLLFQDARGTYNLNIEDRKLDISANGSVMSIEEFVASWAQSTTTSMRGEALDMVLRRTVPSAEAFTVLSSAQSHTVASTKAGEVHGSTGNDIITGAQYNDVLAGGLGNDNLRGMAGADHLYGGGGSDLLEGGAGGDHLSGGQDNDTYLFSSGFGLDTIVEAGGALDVVHFRNTVDYISTGFNRFGDDLHVWNGSANKMVIKNWFSSTDHQIERFEFMSHGVVVTSTEINSWFASAPEGAALQMAGEPEYIALAELDYLLAAEGEPFVEAAYVADDAPAFSDFALELMGAPPPTGDWLFA